MFKVNIKNTRKSFEICSKVTKTPERGFYTPWKHQKTKGFSSVFVVDFEQVNSHFYTLNAPYSPVKCLLTNLCFFKFFITYTSQQKHNFLNLFFIKFYQCPAEAALQKCSSEKRFWQYALQLYWNHTLPWVLSCKFAAYFQYTVL